MSEVIEAVERAFEHILAAMLLVHPPEVLKQRIDAAAAKRAEQAADVAEAIKFGSGT